jgi:GalNAc-alpha-(1->4)-GalNAc-alpha-(1->3)-diNAcBac-PP-undecaprenol alpha-1,4-N-acetyl-D-galactosaminyltransferase
MAVPQPAAVPQDSPGGRVPTSMKPHTTLPPAHPVALYFHRLGTSGGGARRMICLLANALCQREFPVHMITWDAPDAQSLYALDPRVVWNRLGFRPGIIDKLRRTYALARLLRAHRVRVLVGFVMSGDKTVYLAAKLAGARLIVAERSAPIIYHIQYGCAQRWLSFGMLRLADRITVQMPDFVAGYPASLKDRIRVIPNPVWIAERHAQPDMPDANGLFSLLAVGRLEAQKGYECLIGAFAEIAQGHPTWRLHIVGDGSKLETLRSLAAQRGVAERVQFEPWVSDVSGIYARSHLFVMPSLWEGFPNALAEAMSHGLPAIGFREAAGVTNLIAHGETGWLADGLINERGLARMMSEAMSDGAERVRRGASAAESMAAYDPPVQFDLWERLVRAVINTEVTH